METKIMPFMTRIGNQVKSRASVNPLPLRQIYSKTQNMEAKIAPEYNDINFNRSIYISLAPNDDGEVRVD